MGAEPASERRDDDTREDRLTDDSVQALFMQRHPQPENFVDNRPASLPLTAKRVALVVAHHGCRFGPVNRVGQRTDEVGKAGETLMVAGTGAQWIAADGGGTYAARARRVTHT